MTRLIRKVVVLALTFGGLSTEAGAQELAGPTAEQLRTRGVGLRATLRNGSTGTAVRRLQRSLTAALARTVAIDGQFGAGTETAWSVRPPGRRSRPAGRT